MNDAPVTWLGQRMIYNIKVQNSERVSFSLVGIGKKYSMADFDGFGSLLSLPGSYTNNYRVSYNQFF